MYASYADFVKQQHKRTAKHWSNCEIDDAKRAAVSTMERNERTKMNIENSKNAPYVSSFSREKIQTAKGSEIQSNKNSSIEQNKMKGVPEMDAKEGN